MSKKNKTEPASDSLTYVVPGEIGIALTTGRSQFIGGLIKRVREGEVLPAAQVIGLLELVRDWTDDRRINDLRATRTLERLDAAVVLMEDLQSNLDQLKQDTSISRRLTSGTLKRLPPGPEDDVD